MNIKTDKNPSGAHDAEGLLKALANRHRLMILCEMMGGARSVGELARALALRVSTVSQHLALLRRDDLVTASRDGQTMWYSISSAPARRLVKTLCGMYSIAPMSCAAAPRGPGGKKRGKKTPDDRSQTA